MTDTTTATRNSLRILKADEGDLTITWDPENTTEVNLAREAFARAKSQGYFAYEVSSTDNEDRTQLREFNPEATTIVMTPQLVGG